MSQELPEPLHVPERPRRPRLHRYQWIGLPLLFLVPALALAGVFGETQARAEATAAGLALAVDHPTRLRYGQAGTAEITVENRTERALDTVVVAIGAAWLTGFSDVAITPEPARAFEVELTDLAPGETRRVHASLRAERYGEHAGRVEARSPGGEAAVRVHTFLFP